MINKTVKNFLNEVDSFSSTPRSSSVSALVASISVCLVKKSILKTQSNKAFNSYTKEQKEALEDAAMKMNTFRVSFERLINDDIKAYENYDKALLEEGKNKDEIVKNALLICVNVPYTMALTCIETFISIDNMKELIHRDYIRELLSATEYLKTVYECSMVEIKATLDLLQSEAMSDDMADFLVQKSKIENDIKSIEVYLERKI